MKGVVFGGIAPHGSSIIEEIAGSESEAFKPTRDAMIKLGDMLKKHEVDTIVILTPHGLRLQGYNAVYTCEYCSGSLSEDGKTISCEFKCDKPMAKEILKRAVDKGIPCFGANYGALEGTGSNVPMDWGTLIPLWFMGANDLRKPEIVVIGPTRDIEIKQLVELGEIIARVAEESRKKVAIIASADQAHSHDPDGIYGYDPAASQYDNEIISIIKEDKLERLLNIDIDIVEKAKPDSLWQMCILYGVLKIAPLKGTLLSYQVPTYFGMLAAAYENI